MNRALAYLANRRAATLRGMALGVALLLACATPAAAQDGATAGRATLVRGAVTAHLVGSSPRLLGPGSPIFAGDVVSTGKGSLAVLDLADGTRMALRPLTTFQVEQLETEPQQESALLRLFRGGMRAITGLISKRADDAFQVRAGTATIGIRGTTFDVRICEGDDCAGDAARDTRPVVGYLALARGNVRVSGPGGVERPVRIGARIREADTVRTGAGAFAMLRLSDGTRAGIESDSEFRVDRMRQEEQGGAGEALMSFLRGGLRLLTGAIARDEPGNYKVRTPVATIGIRGTGFDLQCQGLCGSPPGSGATPEDGDGMFAEVWQGTIDFDGQRPLSDGALFFSNIIDEPVPVPGVPRAFAVPRPDQVDLPPLPPGGGAAVGPGVYVSCYEGICRLRGPDAEIELQGGQAGVLGEGDGTPSELAEMPGFQTDDPFLRALEPQFREAFELLRDPAAGGELECRV